MSWLMHGSSVGGVAADAPDPASSALLQGWRICNDALCYPLSHQSVGQSSMQQSSDVWATVVANVAPLMALVGERNAKEYMRTTSSWHHFVPLASAPLGILSILVSAIRLSGSGFLQRLIGRESERRSEALVELTPLSVAPATSTYTKRAVEVQPTYDRDVVAFACGHVRDMPVSEAAEGFKQLSTYRRQVQEYDMDREIVMTLFRTSSTLEQNAKLIRAIDGADSTDHATADLGPNARASLSYRATGISPTPTTRFLDTGKVALSHLRDIGSGVVFGFIIVGLQLLAFLSGGSSTQTFVMGVIGYLGIFAFTLGLLAMVKSEVLSVHEVLPKAFSQGLWTFSNSRNTEHRPTNAPPSCTLTAVRPKVYAGKERSRRSLGTGVLSFGVCGSYLLFYLSLRVAPYWVALGTLGTIWLAAVYRSLVQRNFLVATAETVDGLEHWIGIFRNTADESVMATIEYATDRAEPKGKDRRPSLNALDSTDSGTSSDDDYVLVKSKDVKIVEKAKSNKGSQNSLLLVNPPWRTSLHTWSGTQDVMKVALEMAKIRRKTHDFTSPSLALGDSTKSCAWVRLIRFRMAIYVPGIIWRSDHFFDFALPQTFDIEILLRLMLQSIHMCLDQDGTLTQHDVEQHCAVDLSHVLCGPVACPPFDEEVLAGQAGEKSTQRRPMTMTLREVLKLLRDTPSNEATDKYTLQQAVLLPTIMLACAYDRWLYSRGVYGDEIEPLQAKHVDGLALSGKRWLGTMEGEFERLGIWDYFTSPKPKDQMQHKDQSEGQSEGEKGDDGAAGQVGMRDATSGSYEIFNIKDLHMEHARKAVTMGRDGYMG